MTPAEQARQLLQQGDLVEAERVVAAGLSQAKNDGNLLMLQGDLALRRNDWAAARPAYERALPLFLQPDRVRRRLVTVLGELQEWQLMEATRQQMAPAELREGFDALLKLRRLWIALDREAWGAMTSADREALWRLQVELGDAAYVRRAIEWLRESGQEVRGSWSASMGDGPAAEKQRALILADLVAERLEDAAPESDAIQVLFAAAFGAPAEPKVLREVVDRVASGGATGAAGWRGKLRQELIFLLVQMEGAGAGAAAGEWGTGTPAEIGRALWAQGERDFRHGDPERAAEAFRQCLRFHPEPDEVRLQLIRALVSLNDWKAVAVQVEHLASDFSRFRAALLTWHLADALRLGRIVAAASEIAPAAWAELYLNLLFELNMVGEARQVLAHLTTHPELSDLVRRHEFWVTYELAGRAVAAGGVGESDPDAELQWCRHAIVRLSGHEPADGEARFLALRRLLERRPEKARAPLTGIINELVVALEAAVVAEFPRGAAAIVPRTRWSIVLPWVLNRTPPRIWRKLAVG